MARTAWRRYGRRRTRRTTGSRTRGALVAEAELLAPVPRPGKVVAIGRNYRDHTQRGGRRRPVRAADLRQVVELGRRTRRGDPLGSGAHDTGRLRGRARRRHRPHRTSGLRGRGARPRPRATPASTTCRRGTSSSATASGPAASRSTRSARWARPSSRPTRSRDPQALAIECLVNGEVMQRATTADMFFGVAAIISHCSQAFTLEPGDVIATGTPGGRRDLPGSAGSCSRTATW